jgi:hypothetical protein
MFLSPLLMLLVIGAVASSVRAQPASQIATLDVTAVIVEPGDGARADSPSSTGSFLDSLSEPTVLVALIGCLGAIGVAFVTGFFGLLSPRKKSE